MSFTPDPTVTRIPNLPLGKIAEADGTPTDDELTFRQGLLTSLQNYIGNEGLVMPTQTDANITKIQNHVNEQGQHTCAFGTFIYDSTNNTIRVSVDDGSGAPIFKTVTIT